MDKIQFLTERTHRHRCIQGGHQQVTDALADLITRSDNEPTMVGLEGDLGSGKSTVLKLLEQRIADQPLLPALRRSYVV
jgi:ABC-type polysaccharide/polyol phosphate transport system ATPase subunit